MNDRRGRHEDRLTHGEAAVAGSPREPGGVPDPAHREDRARRTTTGRLAEPTETAGPEVAGRPGSTAEPTGPADPADTVNAANTADTVNAGSPAGSPGSPSLPMSAKPADPRRHGDAAAPLDPVVATGAPAGGPATAPRGGPRPGETAGHTDRVDSAGRVTADHDGRATGGHGAGHDGPGLFDRDAEETRRRWQEVQAGFVDNPRGSVERADSLVAEVTGSLLTALENRTAALQDRWRGSERRDTEDLRTDLRDYRALLEELLGLSTGAR